MIQQDDNNTVALHTTSLFLGPIERRTNQCKTLALADIIERCVLFTQTTQSTHTETTLISKEGGHSHLLHHVYDDLCN